MKSTSKLTLWLLTLLVMSLSTAACTEEKKREKKAGTAPTQDKTPPATVSPQSKCLALDDEDSVDLDTEDGEAIDSEDADQDTADDGSSGDSNSTSTVTPACDPPGGPTSGSNEDPPSTTPPSTGSNPIGGGRGIDFSTDLETCREDGKAWLPFGTSGKATCGKPLVTWCCSVANLKSVFGSLPSSTDSKVTTALDQDYQLYGCSKDGTRYELHLLKTDGKKVDYKYIWFSGRKENADKATDSQCVDLSMTDLGLGELGSTEDDGDDNADGEDQDNGEEDTGDSENDTDDDVEENDEVIDTDDSDTVISW